MSDVKITVAEDGSYKIEGPVHLVDQHGNIIETREGKPFYLCRCGHSSNKPFCDGTHYRMPLDGVLADRS